MAKKKDIGILTFHNACNYGAFLQAKALQDKLNEYPDTTAYLIDYKNKKVAAGYSVADVFNIKKGLKVTALKTLRLKDIIKRNRIFSKYQKETFRFIDFDDTQKIEKLHKVVVGSDQVWGQHITGKDVTYFLPFAKPSQRVSYAASAGRIDENFDDELFKNSLEDFSAVSVRERELKERLSAIGVNKDISVVTDPVFLKPKEKWEAFAGKDRVYQKEYILIFLMGVTKQADYIVDRALEIGRRQGVEVLLLNDQERWYKYRNVKHFGVASPTEFVNLIKNAKCVFSNSFHATAFSIILNTPFYIEMNIKNSGRLKALLKLTGLEARTMHDGKLENGYSEDVEWKKVDEKLAVEIQKSSEFVENNIIR